MILTKGCYLIRRNNKTGAIVTTQNSINGKNIVAAKFQQTNYVNDTNDVVLNL